VPEALRVIGAVAGILEAIHGAGLVHRDLKPENVLLDEAGAVRLADFGLALDAQAASLTLTGAILGSLHYMAPEQVRGGAVDQRADVYALGVLAYELLTGHLPIGRFPLPSATAGVPVSVDGAILRALEREPAGRWESAGRFAAALGAKG
jgi:serine/threonine protein kinase